MKKKTIIIMASVILALIIVIIILLLTGGKKITITFDTDGGNEIASIQIKKGSKTILPKPTKDEYIFDGWYMDNTKVDDSYEFTKDTTLKAHWEEDDGTETFTVSFDTDGADEIEPIKVKCGEGIELPEEPTKTEYTFISWENEDKKTINDGDVLECKDTTLTAVWDDEDDVMASAKLTIKFDTKGGNTIKSVKVQCRDAVVPTLPTPEKEGYIFVSWLDKNGKVIHEGESLSCNTLNLYANWKEDPNVKYYYVTFDSKGGSSVDKLKVMCEKELKLPKAPTKDGYTFVSWVDANDKPILDGALLACEDITLYANWNEKESEKKEYECTEGTLKDDKCILEKPANEECPSGYTYSEKASKCYKFISDATSNETETNSCPSNSTYKEGTNLGIDKNGCYSLSDKEKNCSGYSGYELSNGKCIKTVDAKVKE